MRKVKIILPLAFLLGFKGARRKRGEEKGGVGVCWGTSSVGRGDEDGRGGCWGTGVVLAALFQHHEDKWLCANMTINVAATVTFPPITLHH